MISEQWKNGAFPEKRTLFLVLFLLISGNFFGEKVLFSMSDRAALEKLKVYEKDGKKYVRDLIKWNGYCWSRHISYLSENSKPISIKNIVTISGSLEEDLHKIYEKKDERKDLTHYFVGINIYTGEKIYKPYKRRQSKNVIVTDKNLDKPYIRLGIFTIGGKTPPKWKKVKEQIQDAASGYFGADAVIVESWEVLPFRKEDYFPITEFQYPEYVKYHCVAVAFEETAKIPEHLIYKENE